MFPQIQRIPAGSFLYSEAVYDNTTANHHNPNSPPKEIRVGEATTDEMMITYFLFAQYQAGDENYIIDSNAVRLTTGIKTAELKQREIKISPNPSNACLLYTSAAMIKCMASFVIRTPIGFGLDYDATGIQIIYGRH